MNHAATSMVHGFRILKGRIPHGLLRLHASTLMQLHQLLDPLLVALLLPLAAQLSLVTLHPQDAQLAVQAALVLAVLAQRSIVYSSQRVVEGSRLVRRVLELWAGLFGVLMALLFLFKSGPSHSRLLLIEWALLSLVWLLLSHVGSRSMLRSLRLVGRNSRVNAYVGTVQGFARLSQELKANPWMGQRLAPVKVWRDGHPPGSQDLRAAIQQAAQKLGASQWFLDDCGNSTVLRQVLAVLEEQNEPVLMIPDWLSGTSYAPRHVYMGDLPAVVLWQVDPFSLAQMFKCLADWVAAFVLLVLLAPLMVLVSLLVAFDSPGPVLFRQRRYGLNGDEFFCLKFRTMRAHEDGPQVHQATVNDPRITSVGRYLRRYSLDELPQLLNVLRGEMSLVGPRPHASSHNEYYRKLLGQYMRRHALRPGLTGFAQVGGLRGETETLEKMRWRVESDLYYIKNWSLLLDFRILVHTLLRWNQLQGY